MEAGPFQCGQGQGLGPGAFKGWAMPAEGVAGSAISPVDNSEGRDTEVPWEGLSSGQGQCLELPQVPQ